MSEKKSHFYKILALLLSSGVIAAIIHILPDLFGFKSDGNNINQNVNNQSSAVSKTEIHIHTSAGAVSDIELKNPDRSEDEKVVLENKQHGIKVTPSQPVAVKGAADSSSTAHSQPQQIAAAMPKVAPKLDLSGVWQFDVSIIKGKDITGTLFDYHSNYRPTVELTQLGDKISGTYSAPPAIVCGTGSISGSLSEENEVTRVEWILNCTSECEGEQRKFSGTYNQATRTIAGRYVPVKTPTRKGCWLAFENLSGKLDF